MKITWLGHACFLIEGKKRILIDPFLTGNPKAPVKPEDLDVDLILVTHGHGDHLGDAELISKRCNASIVAIYELSVYLSKRGCETIGMNIGGSFDFEGVKISMVKAEHSADIVGDEIVSGGKAVGYIVEDEVTVYHAGDTDVFMDMKLIGEIYSPKVALLPIGGFYTMSPRTALKAIELIKPEIVIPMHYDTFPVIRQNPEEFKRDAESLGVKVVVLKPGESLEV
ncbi:MAG: metal-dependent hydrolase [Archaeoglobales archaeon]|nr:MAG: metal-dependent hydrolase [Archaeoglobales archaeon]